MSEWRDSNTRPLGPKPSTLTGLRYTPNNAYLLLQRKEVSRHYNCAVRAGFEPAVPVFQYDSLANCWFQPLTHLTDAGAKIRQTFSIIQTFAS